MYPKTPRYLVIQVLITQTVTSFLDIEGADKKSASMLQSE